jgi:ABC-type multidrug transport system permease subunit
VYYLDPFKYLLGALMTFTIWDVEVTCDSDEYGTFDPPAGQTCGEYMSPFLSQATGYLRDPVSLDINIRLIA